MAKVLSTLAVRNTKPAKHRREVRDGGARGLYLVVHPSGAKSWALRFRTPGGKNAKLTLGTCDLTGQELEGEPHIGGHLTLPAARLLAAEVHRQRAMGRDVIAERRGERARRVLRDADPARALFPAAARDYAERELRDRKKCRTWAQVASALGLDYSGDGEPTVIRGSLCERWADRAVSEINGDDAHAVIEEARETAIPGRRAATRGPSEARAREMSKALSGMFRWLAGRRRVSSNPFAGAGSPMPSDERRRVLSADELKKVWDACAKVPSPFGALVRVLILTGQRRSEVAGMARSELNGGETWTLPPERTKNKQRHVVHLSDDARSIIEDLPVVGDAGLVFTTNGVTPVSGFGKVKATLDEVCGVDDWRLHDLRRTMATMMAEDLGIEPHVIEAVLNHQGHRSGVAGVYNRATYDRQKRAALDAWAGRVREIVGGKRASNVTRLKRVR